MMASVNTSLGVITADQQMRQTMLSDLSADYVVTQFNSIEHFLAEMNNGSEQLQLLLCDQALLEQQMEVTLAAIKTACPEIQILVIGPSRPIETQVSALRHGARGYFDNSLPTKKLRVALQNILHGEVWVERHVIAGLIDELTHIPTITDQQRQAVESLSAKELEVAKLVSHGATNKMIANKLAITERTVKAHLTTIFHKMGLPDRLSLAIFFRDLR